MIPCSSRRALSSLISTCICALIRRSSTKTSSVFFFYSCARHPARMKIIRPHAFFFCIYNIKCVGAHRAGRATTEDFFSSRRNTRCDTVSTAVGATPRSLSNADRTPRAQHVDAERRRQRRRRETGDGHDDDDGRPSIFAIPVICRCCRNRACSFLLHCYVRNAERFPLEKLYISFIFRAAVIYIYKKYSFPLRRDDASGAPGRVVRRRRRSRQQRQNGKRVGRHHRVLLRISDAAEYFGRERSLPFFSFFFSVFSTHSKRMWK